jgi:AraC family transcriptional regulator
MSDNFGEILGQRLHAEHRPVLLARTLRHTEVAVAEVRLEHPTYERSDPLPPSDAFVVAVQLRDYPVHEWWEDGRRAPIRSLTAGQSTIYDLTRDPRFTINNPFHSIHFELPRRLLDAIADDAGTRRIVGLDYESGAGISDPVLEHLSLALRPSFECPDQANRLFVDHITLAVATHVAVTYGRLRPRQRRSHGRLSNLQHRRAVEFLDAHVDAHVTVAELARHCGLSSSYFNHAFKATTGTTPHRWLLERRVDKSQDLLRRTDYPMAEIALACGFANQSHFTRTFRAHVGCPPVAWRRQHRTS